MMARAKALFRCQDCGFETPKWSGQCPDCGQWNRLVEAERSELSASAERRPETMLTDFSSEVTPLERAGAADPARLAAGIAEVERLLGGGLVPGQVVLLAGPPGIGKSTLTLQLAAAVARPVLYVSGEESLAQVAQRAGRLGLAAKTVSLLCETNVAAVIEAAKRYKPQVLIVDSIQTVFHPELAGGPGTVGQVRACAAELLRWAKAEGAALFLLGHVTKEGMLAGPKVLEHLVDTVLYFESERSRELRLLRCHKNRFGPTSEIGLFEMTGSGLREVGDAYAYFEAERTGGAPAGRAVAVALEGSRAFLAEVQALAVATRYPYPRRMASGFDLNRALVLLAAMEKHLRLRLDGRDVYVNLAGGLKLKDPALDLAVVFAVASSLKDAPVPPPWALIGEVGLLGELRTAPRLEERLKAAAKAGFKKALVAKRSDRAAAARVPGIAVVGAATLGEAFAAVFGSRPEASPRHPEPSAPDLERIP